MKWRQATLVALAIVALGLAGWTLWQQRAARMHRALRDKEAAVRRDISRLPMGLPRPELERFLSARGMESFYQRANRERLYSFQTQTSAAILEARSGNIPMPLYDCRIVVLLHLGDDDRLAGHDQHTVCSHLFG